MTFSLRLLMVWAMAFFLVQQPFAALTQPPASTPSFGEGAVTTLESSPTQKVVFRVIRVEHVQKGDSCIRAFARVDYKMTHESCEDLAVSKWGKRDIIHDWRKGRLIISVDIHPGDRVGVLSFTEENGRVSLQPIIFAREVLK